MLVAHFCDLDEQIQILQYRWKPPSGVSRIGSTLQCFCFQPPADQFSNPNSAEEMLVRKSTNGETWVQHVLEGLTSNFESITVIIAVKHCAKPGSLAYAELRRQTSTTGLQWHEWSSYCYNHPRPRHAAGGQTGTLTQVDSLHEVLLLYFSSDQFWIALRDVSCS